MNSKALSAPANAELIEAMQRLWLDNPVAVDPTWRAFFQVFALGRNGGSVPSSMENEAACYLTIVYSLKQSHVHYLIAAYRAIGHLQAHLDPLSDPPAPVAKLELGLFQLDSSDLDTSFDVGT